MSKMRKIGGRDSDIKAGWQVTQGQGKRTSRRGKLRWPEVMIKIKRPPEKQAEYAIKEREMRNAGIRVQGRQKLTARKNSARRRRKR